jgi:hypothetical protein
MMPTRMMLGGVPCLALALIMAAGAADPLPSGFRIPTESDRTGDWKKSQKEISTPFHASADFNGDGLVDHVWILLRKSGKGWGLFAFLARTGDRPLVVKLDEDNGQTPAQRFGVDVVKAGNYDTACGKGYWACKSGEPANLKLRLPAIDFYMFESANSYFWWDATSKKFKRTWISD